MADVSKVNVNSTDYNIKDSNAMHKGVDRVTAGQKSGVTLGYCATAEGQINQATGNTSHAQGMGTESAANYSHSEGYDTHVLAGADAGHAEGYGVVVNGRAAHGEGYGTLASSKCQHVEGQWNVEDTSNTYAHIIGGGTANYDRKNIFTVDWNGIARDGTQNRLMPFKAVSEAEYAALSQAEKTNGTAYFRYEATGVMREIQDNGSATSLTSGALPTGQTITSYLNSKLVKVVTFTVTSGSTVNFKSLTGIGSLVGGSLEVQTTTSASTWKLLGTISHAPSEAVSVPCVRTGNGTFCGMVKIGTNKEIQLYSTQALSGNAIGFSFAYRTL